MATKSNPIGLRIGIIRTWESRWYAEGKEYKKLLHQDLNIREFIQKELAECAVSHVEIHRTANLVTLHIYSARPGLIIGKQGSSIELLREKLNKKFNEKFDVHIVEIKRPDLDAYLLAESIARQVEKRIPYRRAVKMAISRAMEAGAFGIKIRIAGRLNGVEIARYENFVQGKIPFQTFRADVDYAQIHAFTTYGAIGVRVAIYRGDIFRKKGGELTKPPLSPV